MDDYVKQIIKTICHPARIINLLDDSRREAFILARRRATTTRLIESHGIDFLDFGCKDGRSLNFGKKVFGGKCGLGIDIKPEQVEKARAAGHLAVTRDASSFEVPANCVRFVTMLHFLEHLPSYDLAEKCIATSLRAAREFVYIRHPWFDSDAELLRMGYKLYWSDWTIHPLHFNSLDFIKAILRLGVEDRWCLMGHRPIESTQDRALAPLSRRCDRALVEESEASTRPKLSFKQPVFHDIACLVQTGSNDSFEWARSRIADHVTFIEGRGPRINL